MAEQKIIETRIVLKHDTSTNWSTNNPILLEGEIGIATDLNKFKIGDGTTAWNSLSYATLTATEIQTLIADNKSSVYQGTKTSDSQSDADAITAALSGATAKKDDICIIKTKIETAGDSEHYEYKAFVYNGTDWAAMDGNYSAGNVFLKDNITLAGNYTSIGNYSKGTVINAGTSVQEMLMNMLSQRLQPANPTLPAVSVTFNNGAKEVGTKITPTYTATLSAGSYTYGPDTGITATSWSVVAKDGTTEIATKTTASGSFDEITVTETTSYKVTASATHGAGTVALDNLGSPSNPEKKIAAGTKSKTSNAITGYRSWFYGYKNASGVLDVTNLTSANIRALTASNGSIPSSITTNKMQQMFFAIPKGKKSSISVANSTNGAPQTVTKITDIMVEGANGYAATAYDVWYVSNASAESGTTKFTITVS